jgi:broad specificity phosphatase PhoE
MPKAFVISHPEVVVDPARPVPDWHLSALGVERMTRFALSPIVQGVTAVFSSSETKAIEAAQILGRVRHVPIAIRDGFEEIDRSATGFLPAAEFERTADAFFAEPERSVRGWERAVDAQARIVRAFDRLLKDPLDGDVAVVTHGGVGTLLSCSYSHVPISRKLDQPSQGHYWAFDIAQCRVLNGWLLLENA